MNRGLLLAAVIVVCGIGVVGNGTDDLTAKFDRIVGTFTGTVTGAEQAFESRRHVNDGWNEKSERFASRALPSASKNVRQMYDRTRQAASDRFWDGEHDEPDDERR